MPKRSDNGATGTHEAPRPQRRPTGQNMSEAGAGVVKNTLSNGGIGSVEPPSARRRQHSGRRAVEEAPGLPGVIGLACGEGCSEEDGRSREEPGGEAESDSPDLGKERDKSEPRNVSRCLTGSRRGAK